MPMPRSLRTAASAVVLAAAVGLAGACTTSSPSRPERPGTDERPTSARVLTLEDLAPGLRPAKPRFFNPTPPVRKPGPALSLSLQASAKPVGARFDPANVGLSFEASDLADPRWDPDASYLDELVGALDRPSLRFGGNSVDRRVWWTSTGEPAPTWAQVTLTPEDFARLAAFATKVDATVTLVVDLGHDDPARGADYVLHARRALGARLVAVSVGNEPNGFALASQPQYRMREGEYNPSDYVAELRPYVKAIHARVPGLPIIGPGTFDAPWWRAFGDARIADTAAMAAHWYPLWACGTSGDRRAAPTVGNLVSPWLHDRVDDILGMGLQTAARYRLPLWLEEAGPTSCVGTNETSRTHAQALWTADFTLHTAALGVRRLNYHGMIDACRGGAPMSPLCDTGELGERTPRLRGQSNYLALLQLAEVQQGTIRQIAVAGAPRVHAYAIEDATGVTLVVVNMNDPAGVGPSPLTLALPKGLSATRASVLWADTLDVRNGSKLTPLSPLDAMPSSVNAGSVLAIRLDRP
ncbi:hypothetical protein ACOCJ5_12200 [Knoellia sp. CPCC 206450]|uniref:hypothetical protein n=1 Tax=Knoellia tibetensis TaxID=3404798 RepID=UPI003B429BF9